MIVVAMVVMRACSSGGLNVKGDDGSGDGVVVR